MENLDCLTIENGVTESKQRGWNTIKIIREGWKLKGIYSDTVSLLKSLNSAYKLVIISLLYSLFVITDRC